MTLRINSVCTFNRVTNQYNENRSNVQKYPMTNAKSNAVSFKKNIDKSRIMSSIIKILKAGGGLIVINEFLSKLSSEEREFTEEYLKTLFGEY